MTMTERTYQVIIGILVLIILLGGGWLLGDKMRQAKITGAMATSTSDSRATLADTAMSPTDPDTSSNSAMQTPGASPMTPAPTMPSQGEAISVDGQSAGMIVTVGSVTFSKPGWIAVRDSNSRTLGAAWFPEGTHKDVTVSLLRATTPGMRYQAMLYIDDGDKKFDLHKDTLVTNSDGSVGGTLFTVGQ